MKNMVMIMVWACAGLAFAGEGDAANDKEGVRAAVLDYVEGVYNVKHGFYYKDAKYIEVHMTFDQLVDLAARYNKDNRVPKNAPKEITIFEVKDQTAVAKLVAHWGQDYFHLAKYDGKWMITNVIWQSLPKKE